MPISEIEIIYGVVVRWTDLIKTEYIREEYKYEDSYSEFADYLYFMSEGREEDKPIIPGLVVKQLPHDIAEDYATSTDAIDRLPSTDKLPNSQDKNEYYKYFVIGVNIGKFAIKNNKDFFVQGRYVTDVNKHHHLSFDTVINARNNFIKECPQNILGISGKPELHYVPDDCSCEYCMG